MVLPVVWRVLEARSGPAALRVVVRLSAPWIVEEPVAINPPSK